MYGLGKFLHLRMQGANIDTPVYNLGDMFGTKKGTQTTESSSAPWIHAQPYLAAIMEQGRALHMRPQIANQSPETLQANNLFRQRALGGSPITGAAQDLGLGMLQGKYLDPYQNPHFRPALDQTLGDIRSSINSQFKGSNFGNSAHQEWLGHGLMSAAAPALSQAFQQNQDRQFGLLGMAPALANMDYSDIGVLSDVGARKDARAQTEMDSPWLALQRYQQAVNPAAGMGSQGTQQTPYYVNNTANTLGAAASGLGAYLGFAAMSDRRAKKDIEKVGEREDGLGIYEFRYKTDPDNAQKRIGFMADEVERVNPDAVFERDGLQWVNYGALVK
jgi:hypothetical protein